MIPTGSDIESLNAFFGGESLCRLIFLARKTQSMGTARNRRDCEIARAGCPSVERLDAIGETKIK